MDPINPINSLYYVARDVDGVPGQFHLIENITGVTVDHASEDPTETRVFGRAEAHARGGELTHDWTADGLWTPADLDGQRILWEAYLQKERVWMQVLFDGNAGYMQRCLVTGVSHPNEADATNVEVSFTIRGIAGSLQEVNMES